MHPMVLILRLQCPNLYLQYRLPQLSADSACEKVCMAGATRKFALYRLYCARGSASLIGEGQDSVNKKRENRSCCDNVFESPLVTET